jgi:hypothetical protein
LGSFGTAYAIPKSRCQKHKKPNFPGGFPASIKIEAKPSRGNSCALSWPDAARRVPLYRNCCCIILPMTAIRVFLSLLFLAVLFVTITQAQSISTVDRRAARKVSDSLMADLVANRTSDATQKMGAWQYAQMIDGCGRPLDSRIANNGAPVVGEDVSTDGRTKNTLIFQYVCKSTRHSGWVFKVTVEMAEDAKYHVSGFGCGKPSN